MPGVNISGFPGGANERRCGGGKVKRLGWQDGRVPDSPPPPPPSDGQSPEAVFAMIFSEARVVILHYMREHPGPLTRVQISAGTGISASWTADHLALLERFDAVRASLPPEQRKGRRDVTWWRNDKRIAELLAQLAAALDARGDQYSAVTSETEAGGGPSEQ